MVSSAHLSVGGGTFEPVFAVSTGTRAVVARGLAAGRKAVKRASELITDRSHSPVSASTVSTRRHNPVCPMGSALSQVLWSASNTSRPQVLIFGRPKGPILRSSVERQ